MVHPVVVGVLQYKPLAAPVGDVPVHQFDDKGDAVIENGTPVEKSPNVTLEPPTGAYCVGVGLFG